MTVKEAIGILKNTIVQFGRNNGKTAYAEALQMAIKALEERHWTSVTEGNPKDYQHVLVTIKAFGRRFVKDALYVEDLTKYDEFTFTEHRPGFVDFDSEWGSYEERDVLAWMPVIKPWEGKEHEADYQKE